MRLIGLPELIIMLLLLAAPLLAAAPDFDRDVRPILESRCAGCHAGAKPAGGLRALDAQSVRAQGRAVLAAVSGEKPRMPKSGAPLEANQVAVLRRWIESGGPTWWSLKPLAPYRAGQSIDAFIEAKLRENGLAPSPEADRPTLIRRVYFDLHGLPPSTAEIDAFVNDRAPDAYERLADRLLRSPRHGERWARHWLDVAHYGDTHGYDKDKPRPNAWPYRDWVIRALNEDLPYAEFVRRQIAGDALYPDDPQATVATGFLAAGPWDFVGHQELRDGTTDKNLTRLLDRDDMLAATMSTFTSMTVHCARCHDHKFDPIPQAEYYGLQAVFAGIDRADRPYDDDPALHRKRAGVLDRKRQAQVLLQPLLDKVEFAASPELEEIDNRIRDAKLLLAHLGEPKNAAEAEEKRTLQARADRDQKLRQASLEKLVGAETFTSIDRHKAAIKEIDAELAALPKPKLVYAAAPFFERVGNFRPSLEPRNVRVLARGNVNAPGAAAIPGALSALPLLQARFASADDGGRRAELALWIAAKENPLTWRSIVNRVWHHHFGAGLSETPNDFGRMGSAPSHPELLDWLAVWFRDEAGGSLKRLHREIVLSRAYRQSSANRTDGTRVDANNRLLWRMNRTRLDAETVRDSVLAAAGKLDPAMGGPGVQMFWFKNDHSPIYDYARFDPDGEGSHRRSVYRFVVRSVPDPFLERLDCPDPSLLAPKRSTTLTAIQALALWNNPFMLRMSEHLAARAGSASEAVRLTLGRPPTVEEAREFGAYAEKHGLPNLARLLFNTNEFLFAD